MTTVEQGAVIDRCHHNGDPFWDGDQTLYRMEVVEGDEREILDVVVPRGDAFIPLPVVRRHVEHLSLDELRSKRFSPGPGRHQQIVLCIESVD